LLDQIRLFVVELFVFGSFRVKAGKEFDKFVLIAQQNFQNRLGFVGVGNKYLKKINVNVNIGQNFMSKLTLNTWKASN
jgi:hypothetical protein